MMPHKEMNLQKRFITANLLRKFENGIQADVYDSLELLNDDNYGITLVKNGTVVALVKDYWSAVHLEYAIEINSIIGCSILERNGRNLSIEVTLEPKIINKINITVDKLIGIYAIECEENRLTYVGQSSNINRRFTEHVNNLSVGFHHNVDLQDTWIEHQNSTFNFKLIEEFPNNYKGTIEDRKWLEINEMKWIEHFNKLELCLNRTKGEFIETRTTLIEKEKIKSLIKKTNEINDQKIKSDKRSIKNKILELEEIIESENQRLEPLRIKINEINDWIARNSRFFSFLESSIVKKNKELKNQEKYNLDKILNTESSRLRESYKEIKKLESEYRLLRTSKQKKLRVYD